jgi:bla regulator protein blaR1
MITQLLNGILCSALFLLVYKLIFEKEKTSLFNRFYLITSLAFSLLIPWVTIDSQNESSPLVETIIRTIAPPDFTVTPVVERDLPIDWRPIILFVYLAGCVVMLVRFITNIAKLILKIKNNERVKKEYGTLILLNDSSVSYSFLQYIFLNKKDFENDTIEREIVLHEAAHARQIHSLDIILIELIQLVFWFNPILILYKKAIQLNHEFLADEAVIKSTNWLQYQQLLLAKANTNQYSILASQFNYLTTKKRLLMMTKTTSAAKALCLQLLVVPILMCAFFLFTSNAMAQDTTVSDKFKKLEPEATVDGVPKELVAEYETLSVKAKEAKGWVPGKNGFTQADSYRLETIFLSMSNEQREKQAVTFIRIPPLAKNIPTPEEFEALKDPRKYGVWLDDKKINNDELNKYTNSDFSQFSASILMKNARVNVNYDFQAGLMTNKYYQEYLKNSLAEKHLNMMIKN